MPLTTMVHVRVDEKVKEEASATLAAMGISVSDAVRMMLGAGRGREGAPVRSPRSECNHGQSDAIRREKTRQALPFTEGIIRRFRHLTCARLSAAQQEEVRLHDSGSCTQLPKHVNDGFRGANRFPRFGGKKSIR
jgi:DNA-damage-inducible protein J